MAGTHTGNTQPSIDQEEHRSVGGVNAKAVTPYYFDAATGSLVPATNNSVYTTHIYTDATYTYICEADPGTALSSASWRITRVDGSGNTDYAATATFTNSATNLTTVQGYSYS